MSDVALSVQMHMLTRKLSEQNDRISNQNLSTSSSGYDDIDGYVSVRGRRRSTPPLSTNIGAPNNNPVKPYRRSSLFNLSFSRWGGSGRNAGASGNSGKNAVRGIVSHLNAGFKSSK